MYVPRRRSRNPIWLCALLSLALGCSQPRTQVASDASEPPSAAGRRDASVANPTVALVDAGRRNQPDAQSQREPEPAPTDERIAGVLQLESSPMSAFTCALLGDGTVRCWGANSDGQLGQGDVRARGQSASDMGKNLAAIDLGQGRTARQIAVGSQHACAVLDDGNVKCWGDNALGALGLGDIETRGDEPGEMGDALPAVELGAGRKARAVSAGNTFSCALLDSREVKCWGRNDQGQAGQGHVRNLGDEAAELGDALPSIALGTGARVRALASGVSHSCVILESGALKCWGSNHLQKLGPYASAYVGDEPGEMGDALLPQRLGTDVVATAVSPADGFTCALLSDGALKCWGSVGYGQVWVTNLADPNYIPGPEVDVMPPVRLGESRKVIAMDTGDEHACALLDDGTVKCWGMNWAGRLGTADSEDYGGDHNALGPKLPPVALASGMAYAVATGSQHSCALLAGGIKCWGANDRGELGVGSAAMALGALPEQLGSALPYVDLGSVPEIDPAVRKQTLPRLPSYESVSHVAAGGEHSCAIRGPVGPGAVVCWGSDRHGETRAPAGDFRLVGSSIFRSCGLTAAGKVQCWGYAYDTEPAADLPPLESLSIGSAHGCGLDAEQHVHCWGLPETHATIYPSGRFTSVRLGWSTGCAIRAEDASLVCWDTALPPGPPPAGRFKLVSPGESYHCALREQDGTLVCWGRDFDPMTPLPRGSFVDIAVGHAFGCGLRTDGSIACWGEDREGSTTPPAGAYSQISAHYGHACAVRDDGRLLCWGDNAHRQIDAPL